MANRRRTTPDRCSASAMPPQSRIRLRAVCSDSRFHAPRGIRLATVEIGCKRSQTVSLKEEIAMANLLDNCKVAILAMDGFEEVEL
ncbi:hypothetical protein AB3X93_38340, partial [Paraburkholderia sp. BR14262]